MTNEYTIHEDAKHRGEMCRMLSGRIAEQDIEIVRLKEEVRRLRMRYHGCGDELVKGKAEIAHLREQEGKSYAEIQPALAECLKRFTEVFGDRPVGGNTIWAYTMAACDELVKSKLEVARYREALGEIEVFAQMLCETQHQIHPAHRSLISMIAARARAALEATE